jgi:tetratricopeptide (TPR) repeat protein
MKSKVQQNVSLTDHLWMVPYEKNNYFAGREHEISTIVDKFSAASLDHYRVALSGLGGVGKSQVALEYLYRSRRAGDGAGIYDHFFWVTGDERTTYIRGIQQIGQKLKFRPSIEDLHSEDLVREIFDWLQFVPRWLLVVDNLDEPAILTNNPNLMPRGTPNGGHVLITTRNAHLGACAKVLEIPMLTIYEGTRLLVARSKPDLDCGPNMSSAPKDAMEIVEELGLLPLAIEYAAGFIRESHSEFEDFLNQYRHSRDFLSHEAGICLNYSRSLVATWTLSFDSLKRRVPEAFTLLTLFAFLNPDNISIDFLQAGKTGLDEPLQLLITNISELQRRINAICDYSLVRRQGKDSVTMHRLVQDVLKECLETQDAIQWRKWVVGLCSRAFPWVRQKELSVQREFHDQVMPCISDPQMEKSEESADLICRMAWYLDCEGQYIEVQTLRARAIEMYRSIQGPDSVQAYICMDHSGYSYTAMGRIPEAIKTLECAFESLRRILGPTHTDTLACQKNFGEALLKGGDRERGMRLLEDACHTQRRTLGDENFRTHSSMRRLAAAYTQFGRINEAITLLEIVKEKLADANDRRGTYRSVMAELGWAYCQTGRIAEGFGFLQRAHALLKDSLGDKARKTSECLAHLGLANLQLGETSLGLERLQNALKAQEEHLGIRHPATIVTLGHLAQAYERLGQERENSKIKEEIERRVQSTPAP